MTHLCLSPTGFSRIHTCGGSHHKLIYSLNLFILFFIFKIIIKIYFSFVLIFFTKFRCFISQSIVHLVMTLIAQAYQVPIHQTKLTIIFVKINMMNYSSFLASVIPTTILTFIAIPFQYLSTLNSPLLTFIKATIPYPTHLKL